MDSNSQQQQEKQNDINLDAFTLQDDSQTQNVQTENNITFQQVQNSSQQHESQQQQTNQNQQENSSNQTNKQNLDNVRQSANIVCQEIIQKVIETSEQQNQDKLNDQKKDNQVSMQQNISQVQGNVQEPSNVPKNETNIAQNKTVLQNQDEQEQKSQQQEDEQKQEQNLIQQEQVVIQDNDTQQGQVNDNNVEQQRVEENLENSQQENKPEEQQKIQEQNMSVQQEEQKLQNEPENSQQQTQPIFNQTNDIKESSDKKEQPIQQDQNQQINLQEENIQKINLQNLQPYVLQKEQFLNLLTNKDNNQSFKGIDQLQNQVKLITQGKNHTLILTKNGEVYSRGSNEFGQTGTNDNSQTFNKVELDDKVDLLDAGQNFSFAANSKTGVCYIWGKLSSKDKNLVQYNSPCKLVNKKLTKDLIQDIRCGNNHILILSKNRVYVYGDDSYGALGNVFRKEINKCDFDNLTTINLKGVEKIFAFGNQSFAVTKRTKKSKNKQLIYCFGSNNYQQLGFESELQNNDIERLPFQWTEIHGDQIQDIVGTDEYSMVLYRSGLIYASGQNDKGQMGQIDKESEPFGTFELVKNIPFKVSKLKCFGDINFAIDQSGSQNYVWGSLTHSMKNDNKNQQNFFNSTIGDMSYNEDFQVILAENDKNENKKKREYFGPELSTTNKTRIQQQLN